MNQVLHRIHELKKELDKLEAELTPSEPTATLSDYGKARLNYLLSKQDVLTREGRMAMREIIRDMLTPLGCKKIHTTFIPDTHKMWLIVEYTDHRGYYNESKTYFNV